MVYRETHISHLHCKLFSWFSSIMLFILLLNINVLNGVSIDDNVNYVQKYGKTRGDVLYLKDMTTAPQCFYSENIISLSSKCFNIFPLNFFINLFFILFWPYLKSILILYFLLIIIE